MKKFFTKVLSLVIIATIFLSVLTFNVSAASATISCDSEYDVGKTFNVTIRFNADATLYAVEVDVSYNSSVLRLNSVAGADYNLGNNSIKIVDDGFSATKPSKTSVYTLNFTAIAAGNSNITASILGGGEKESRASASAKINVVTPKPSSNANFASIKVSSGSLEPAFNANTTEYNVAVKYNIDEITITGAVADGGATYMGGGTFGLNIGDNSRTLTVTAADGTKKSYTINVKRMTEEETAAAEQAERDANPLLVVIDDADYTIVDDFKDITIPEGFKQSTVVRREKEIPVLEDEYGEYILYILTDADGEKAFYVCDDDDNFTRVNYINANGKMYIIEQLDVQDILPEAYVETTRNIDGVNVKVYGYADDDMKDFYIIKCYVDGNRAYYRFDSLEGTMQRATDFELAVKNATAMAAASQEAKNSSPIDWFKNMSTTGKIVFILVILFALALIAFAVILIIKIVSSSKNTGDGSNKNNDFIIGNE